MTSLKFIKMLILLLIASDLAFAQVPPAQGPGAVGSGTIFSISMEDLRDIILSKIEESILPRLNQVIEEADPPVPAKVTLQQINSLQPLVKQTNYTDQPNTKYLVARFEVQFEIKIRHLPNKRMRQRIDIECIAKNWFLPSGDTLTITATAYKPRILDAGVTEKIINLLTLGYYTSMVNEQINRSLPGSVSAQINTQNPDARFNRMNIDANNTADYTDDLLLFQFKATPPRPVIMENTIRVIPLTIKRLNVFNIDTERPVYDSVENIRLELHVNHRYEQFTFLAFREQQQRSVNSGDISVPAPGAGQSLVLIWNIQQSTGKTDSRFHEYGRSVNFGNGTRTIRIKKSFILRPWRLPNGQLSKPTEVSVDAYEITYRIEDGLNNSIGYK